MRKPKFSLTQDWPLVEEPWFLLQGTQQGTLCLVPGWLAPQPQPEWSITHLQLAPREVFSISANTAPKSSIQFPNERIESFNPATLLKPFCLTSYFDKSVEQYRSKPLFPFSAVSERNFSHPGDTLYLFKFSGDFPKLSPQTWQKLGMYFTPLLEFYEIRGLAKSLQGLEPYLGFFFYFTCCFSLHGESKSNHPLLLFRNKPLTLNHRQRNNSLAWLPASSSA